MTQKMIRAIRLATLGTEPLDAKQHMEAMELGGLFRYLTTSKRYLDDKLNRDAVKRRIQMHVSNPYFPKAAAAALCKRIGDIEGAPVIIPGACAAPPVVPAPVPAPVSTGTTTRATTAPKLYFPPPVYPLTTKAEEVQYIKPYMDLIARLPRDEKGYGFQELLDRLLLHTNIILEGKTFRASVLQKIEEASREPYYSTVIEPTAHRLCGLLSAYEGRPIEVAGCPLPIAAVPAAPFASLPKEKEYYNQYFDAFNATTDEFERVRIMVEMMDRLLTIVPASKSRIVFVPGFEKKLKAMYDYFKGIPRLHALILPRYKELCTYFFTAAKGKVGTIGCTPDMIATTAAAPGPGPLPTGPPPGITAPIRPTGPLAPRPPTAAVTGAPTAAPVVATATAPPPITALSYISKGSYGCAVKPALPNRVGATWVSYPNDVTKFFFKEKNAIKAIASAEDAYRIMGSNQGQRIFPYEYKGYRPRNIPNDVRTRCHLDPYGGLYPVRMPNLGYDVRHAKDHVDEYRRISLFTILLQMYKTLVQVQKLRDAGYIHGDIRETNVMAHPDTGVFTIIDFDWLYPRDRFIAKYGLEKFYNNPPDILVLPYHRRIMETATVFDVNSFGFVQGNIEDYHQYLKEVEPFKKLTIKELKESMVDNIAFMRSAGGRYATKDQFIQVIMDYFDSFGLGFTLLHFVMTVYPSVTEPYDVFRASLDTYLTDGGRPYDKAELDRAAMALYEFTQNVLKPVCSIRMAERIPIEEAVSRSRSIFGGLGIPLPPPGEIVAPVAVAPTTTTTTTATGPLPVRMARGPPALPPIASASASKTKTSGGGYQRKTRSRRHHKHRKTVRRIRR